MVDPGWTGHGCEARATGSDMGVAMLQGSMVVGGGRPSCRREDEMLKGEQAELRMWTWTRKRRGSPNSTAQVDLAILVCEYTVITITDAGLDMLCHANKLTKKWHCMV